MRLRAGARTDIGRVRKLNEDAFVSSADEGLFVVCDGMGGAPAGEVASQIAIASILRRLNEDGREVAAQAPDQQSYLPQTSRLADAVRRSNEAIYRQARHQPAQAGMGTTVVGAWIRQHVASVAHVGDSRAYLWHDDRLEPLTRDHSLSEAHANVLVRVLGREPDVDVELKEVPVQPGDYVLLCSDGLTRMVSERVLAQAIFRFREPQRICDFLIAAANENGGSDNITVVVVEVAGSRWRRLMNRWTRSDRRGHDADTNRAV
jgi:PPM family protein phosphatase